MTRKETTKFLSNLLIKDRFSGGVIADGYFGVRRGLRNIILKELIK